MSRGEQNDLSKRCFLRRHITETGDIQKEKNS